MTLPERHIGDAVVLDLDGRLTLEGSSGRLKDKINSLLHQGTRQLCINLGNVSYVDSGGLGHRSRHLLVITKLLAVFETYDSEEDALESLVQRVA